MATPRPRHLDETTTEDPFDGLLREAARLTPRSGSRSVPLHPGQRLCGDRFELLRRIGAGGSGVVYAALDHVRGTPVALKALSRLDPAAIYALKNEFRGAARITHDNLVRLHGLFADGDEWLLTMELVDGVCFDAWVRPEGTLDPVRLRDAAAQLVAGVGAIHAAGKLHRDLKPSNVLVTPQGRVVVLDFGLVSSAEPGDAGQTVDDGFIRGTPAYMAPEQAAGGEVGAPSDWYAVGVMLYEALCGQVPFDGPTLSVLGRKQNEDAPPLPAPVPPALVELARCCTALLQRMPAARPRAPELAAALGADGDGREPAAVAPGRRGPRALSGRDAELAALDDALRRSTEGVPVVLCVSGEAGIGKTALVEHFLHAQRRDGRAVVFSGRIGERESLPYRAIDPIVDDLTRHLRRLGEIAAAALMPRDVAELARIFPALKRVECAASAPLRPADSPQIARRRAFAALTELLARVRDRQPLIVFVDDMQWADADSLRLLDHLLAEPDPAPMLMILGFSTGAEESAGALERIAHASCVTGCVEQRELSLSPLDADAAGALVTELLGACDDGGALRRSVVEQAGGNPMLVWQLARHVAARRAAGELQPRVSWPDALGLPIGALNTLAATLLQLLAVSVRPLPRQVLAAAAEAPAVEVQAALDELQDARLVAELGQERVECRHQRIAAAVRATLAPARVAEHHRALADAWETHGEADPALLFEHRLACGQGQAAGRHAVAAAERAREGLALDRAAELLTRAMSLLPEAEMAALSLRQRQAEALSMSGQWSAASAAFDAAAQRARAPDERRELLRRAAVHGLGSGRGEALPQLRRALVAEGLYWPRTRLGALTGTALRLWGMWWQLSRGRHMNPGPSEPVAESERAALERLFEAAVLIPPHDFARGAHFVSVFSARALRRGDAGYRAVALAMLAVVFVTQRWTRALSRHLAKRAAEQARGTAATSYLGGAALTVVALHAIHTGRCAEALRLSDEAMASLQRLPAPRAYEAWAAQQVRACSLLMLGRAAEAAGSFAAAAQAGPDLGDGGGGDAVLRHLVADDVGAARALLARKHEALQGDSVRGTLFQVHAVERLLCDLYAGRGADALASWPGGAPVFHDFLNVDALLACCALQQDAGGSAARSRVRRAIGRLRGHADLAASAAIAAQLRAACQLHDGDLAGARRELDAAIQHYATAGMRMHALVLQLRDGRLQGGEAGAHRAQKAQADLRALGLSNPEAWARMIAPGL